MAGSSRKVRIVFNLGGRNWCSGHCRSFAFPMLIWLAALLLSKCLETAYHEPSIFVLYIRGLVCRRNLTGDPIHSTTKLHKFSRTRSTRSRTRGDLGIIICCHHDMEWLFSQETSIPCYDRSRQESTTLVNLVSLSGAFHHTLGRKPCGKGSIQIACFINLPLDNCQHSTRSEKFASASRLTGVAIYAKGLVEKGYCH